MKVTDVRIRKITQDVKMKAIVSVTLNEQFVIHDIRIIDGPNGLFVAMPSRRIPGGGFRDIAHPISSEARRHLQQAVLEAYEAELAGYLLQA
jgi:stage V sporulation protein G